MEERNGAAEDVIQEESRVLAEWALGIVSEWDDLLASSLELAASLLRARWCALFLLDGDRGRLLLARLWDNMVGANPDPKELFPGSPEWEAVESNSPVAVLRPEVEWLGVPPRGDVAPYPCCCLPVDVEGTRFGVVEVIREAGDDPFLLADQEAMRLVARHLSLWLNSGAILRRLRELAITDGLTAVYNHRYFQDRLELELERAARYNRPLSLIMLDLNHFKRYNDLFGHQQGDEALRLIASVIHRVVRRIDVVARYGGDEFAAILPETDSLQALVVAARIARALRAQNISFPSGTRMEQLSISVGISSFPELAGSKEELIAQADEALYRAKRSRTRTIRLWEIGWQQDEEANHGVASVEPR